MAITKEQLKKIKELHDRILLTKENLRSATSEDDKVVAEFETYLFDLTEEV